MNLFFRIINIVKRYYQRYNYLGELRLLTQPLVENKRFFYLSTNNYSEKANKPRNTTLLKRVFWS